MALFKRAKVDPTIGKQQATLLRYLIKRGQDKTQDEEVQDKTQDEEV